jgi:hypothetical protein
MQLFQTNSCETQGSSGLGTSKTIVVDDKHRYGLSIQNWKPRMYFQKS